MTNILLFPFVLLWRLAALVSGMAGRLVALALGLVLLLVGALLTATVIGAILGIPLLLVGFALVIRALF